jgi:hypothetical protein
MELNSIETRQALVEAAKLISKCDQFDLDERLEISLDLRHIDLDLLSGIRTPEQMQESLYLAMEHIRRIAKEDGKIDESLMKLVNNIERAGMAHDFMYSVFGADPDAEPVTAEDFKDPDMVDDEKDMPVWYVTKRGRLVCDIASEPDLIALIDQGITVWHTRPSEEQIEEAKQK